MSSKFLSAVVVASAAVLSAAPAHAAVTVADRLSATGTQDIFFDWIGGAFTARVDGAATNGIADPEIFLFRDNGSSSGALTGALVDQNDDISYPTNLSALISRNLQQGKYVLSVGTYNFTQAEARLGIADFTPGERRFVATFADGTTLAGTGAVPEPATWAMMLAGFGAVGFAMRRRANVRTTVAFA